MTQRVNPSKPTSDQEDIARFDALADDWWNADGAMAPLHRMNPTRLEWLVARIKDKFKSLNKLSILDVGCGGGLVSEPLARLGATVTGIDGAADLIGVAVEHAKNAGLKITYRHALTADLLTEKKRFDVVIASEVIEHVPDQQGFVQDLADLVNPGGLVLLSTLNRTPQSFARGIVAAEYLLRWLPPGTHNWKQFVKPSELYTLCKQAGLMPVATCGMTYAITTQTFALSEDDLSVNYFLSAVKP